MKTLEEATKEELIFLIMNLSECTPIDPAIIDEKLKKIRLLFRKKESIH